MCVCVCVCVCGGGRGAQKPSVSVTRSFVCSFARLLALPALKTRANSNQTKPERKKKERRTTVGRGGEGRGPANWQGPHVQSRVGGEENPEKRGSMAGWGDGEGKGSVYASSDVLLLLSWDDTGNVVTRQVILITDFLI
ncbi:hypothetical protein BU24DRAFT_180997 [Aaosphaeria arxii CBS 175.79]|uniref:Uncharacterized protein n=1 Tax=Aaosphaeria arxii CBS 175.79 TaxID=1450172 RepID=A0A6A5XRN2_9PLEO|nr:uncharacterized protein BU24DRAFT_180997 [Aaosphaeria arxii CBS 175.79]KAF2015593.1 hypothetical protein BU24DRAFT_180997 [Aaosphaeria arxii CBS 175.79]